MGKYSTVSEFLSSLSMEQRLSLIETYLAPILKKSTYRQDRLEFCCPLHNDRTPSARLFLKPGPKQEPPLTFKCFVCGSMDFVSFLSQVFSCSKRQVAADIFQLDGRSPGVRIARPVLPVAHQSARDQGASIPMAEKLWRLTHDAATDDGDDEDLPVVEWAESRGLFDSLCNDLTGILRRSHLEVPGILKDTAWWFSEGYRLMLPLFDVTTGDLVNVQAIRVKGTEGPKARFPTRGRGSVRVAGAVFANKPARRLFHPGAVPHGGWVVIVEGGPDLLAVGQALYDVPVLAVPGSSNAKLAAGPWCQGHKVLLALDSDDAGLSAAQVLYRAINENGGQPEAVEHPHGAKDACNLLDLGWALPDLRSWFLGAMEALDARSRTEAVSA